MRNFTREIWVEKVLCALCKRPELTPGRNRFRVEKVSESYRKCVKESDEIKSPHTSLSKSNASKTHWNRTWELSTKRSRKSTAQSEECRRKAPLICEQILKDMWKEMLNVCIYLVAFTTRFLLSEPFGCISRICNLLKCLEASAASAQCVVTLKSLCRSQSSEMKYFSTFFLRSLFFLSRFALSPQVLCPGPPASPKASQHRHFCARCPRALRRSSMGKNISSGE